MNPPQAAPQGEPQRSQRPHEKSPHVRREVVQELSAAGLSTRAIAPVVGAHFTTVADDLRSGVGSPTPAPSPTSEHVDTTTGEVTSTGTPVPAAGRVGAALSPQDLTRIMGEAAARRFEEHLAERPIGGAPAVEGAHTPARTPASPQVSGGPLDARTSATARDMLRAIAARHQLGLVVNAIEDLAQSADPGSYPAVEEAVLAALRLQRLLLELDAGPADQAWRQQTWGAAQ